MVYGGMHMLWLSTILYYRFLLGMFDPPNIQPYWNITVDQVNTALHQVGTSYSLTPNTIHNDSWLQSLVLACTSF